MFWYNPQYIINEIYVVNMGLSTYVALIPREQLRDFINFTN